MQRTSNFERVGLPERDAQDPECYEALGAELHDARAEKVMMEIKKMDFAREAEIFKALGHPIRLKIVYGLLKMGGCNVKNMQECLGLHQATVSQHLIHLKSRGIITSTRQGLEMVYTVVDAWAKCVIDNIEKRSLQGQDQESHRGSRDAFSTGAY